MSLLDSTIRVRIEGEVRQLFELEAKSRGLKLSDIVREAMTEFAGSHNLVAKHLEKSKHEQK